MLLTRQTLVATTCLAIVGLGMSAARADEARLLLRPPSHDHHLPRFGFSSFNIRGYGERVTSVRWGGLAARLGLEPGDTILRMNDVPLTYHGSWNDALHHAIYEHHGHVRLRIRDVRTGRIAVRETYVGHGHDHGHGPITPKVHGPITKKHVVGKPHLDHGDNHRKGRGDRDEVRIQIQKIAELLD